jgi:hypothetical protein
MKYQNLLFSRSFNQDYRWILTPSFLSSSDLDKLERLIWSDEGRRYLEGLSLRPTFLIRLPNAYALCRFYRTNFTDSRKRPIDCIDGIAISLADSWFLRFALAWLLTDQTHILDSWKKLDFDKVDSYTRKVPETQEFDLNSLTEKNSMLFDGHAPIRKEFPFSQSGFEKLVSYLYPSPNIEDLELLEFAYGVSPSMVSRYQSFDIVTPLDSKASFPSQIEKTNYQIPSKPAISAYQKSSVHLPPSGSKSSVPTSSEFDEKVRKLREGGSQNQIVSPPPPKKRKPSLFERLFWGIHDDDE